VRESLVVMLIVSTSVAAALFGCAHRTTAPSESDARSGMSGMTARQVAACLGRPGTQLRQGSTVVWSYTQPGGADAYISTPTDPTSIEFDYSQFDAAPSSGSFNAAVGPPAQAACTVDVILDHGRVGALNFLGPNGQMTPHAQQCGVIVEPCIKS
jgi:hypothetical protein